MPFPKGQSGNPKGRPPKPRALATLLEKSAKVKPEDGGGKSNKELFAEKVWQALTTGVIPYPDTTYRETVINPKTGDLEEVEKIRNNSIVLDAKDFIALTKAVLSHLDGPVNTGATNINVNAANNGKGAVTQIVFNNVPGRTAPPVMDDIVDDDDDLL